MKFPFQWWEKHGSMFPTIEFFAYQILNIVGLQIKIEMIYFLAGILINLRTCLPSNNLDKLFFVNKIGSMTLGLVVNPFLV
jgi:hypothetical protein